MSNFEDVKRFMETFGQMVRTKPQFPDEKTMRLRFDLIKEELNELEQAMKTTDIVPEQITTDKEATLHAAIKNVFSKKMIARKNLKTSKEYLQEK